jgi:FkbM family methyltransferase
MGTAAFAARALPPQIKKAIYSNRRIAKLIRSTLNRGVQHGLVVTTIAAGNLSGMRLYLDLQTEKDLWLGTYEPELQKAICDFVEPGTVAYDIGANIGYITLQLAKAVGLNGRVLAFEPLPSNIERLEKNLLLNGFTDQVQITPAAVVDRTGPVRFKVGPSVGTGKVEGSSGRDLYADRVVLRVNGIAIDDLVFDRGKVAPDLIKLDIEGGEVLALPGMGRVLREIHPLMLLEIHGPEAADAAWRILLDSGYRIRRMEAGYRELTDPRSMKWKEYLVALPEDR